MYLDIFILIVLVWALFNGWRQGFVKELVSAGGFLVGLFVAATCYGTLGEYLSVDGSESNMVTSIVAFFILWIIVPIFLGFVANLLTRALKGLRLGLPNSLLGAGVSLLKYVILISCVLNVMDSLRILNDARTATSHLYAPAKGALGYFFEKAAAAAEKNDTTSHDTAVDGDTVWIDVRKKP